MDGCRDWGKRCTPPENFFFCFVFTWLYLELCMHVCRMVHVCRGEGRVTRGIEEGIYVVMCVIICWRCTCLYLYDCVFTTHRYLCWLYVCYVVCCVVPILALHMCLCLYVRSQHTCVYLCYVCVILCVVLYLYVVSCTCT